MRSNGARVASRWHTSSGGAPFYDREFRVTPATLIPRPETELLLEAALASLTGNGAGSTVADIGTGCGALAICFGGAPARRARVG